MLLGNKVVLLSFPFPLALTFVQLFSAALLTLPVAVISGLTKLSKRQFGLYVLEGALFSVSIFASLKSLSLTNVGTVIIGRSCLPMVVYAGERLQGKTASLTWRSCCSLGGVLAFATLYAFDAKGVRLTLVGLLWVIFWLFLVAVQMIYGKWLVGAVNVSHVERVFYTNFCGLPLFAPLASSEAFAFYDAVKLGGPYQIICSCLTGVTIGYTSWRLRALISATSFSLIGVLNKMLTVCVAITFWHDEGSSMSLIALVGCLVSGFFYEGDGGKAK